MKLFLCLFVLLLSLQAFSRPFAEYEKAKYLFMSHSYSEEIKKLQKKIIDNLPDGVEVRLYYSFYPGIDYNDYPNVEYFRYEFVSLWARDILPYAVLKNVSWSFVWPYEVNPHDFETSFDRQLSTSYSYIPGGNLLADSTGRCFIIHKKNPFLKKTLQKHYGCTDVVRFNQVDGIGHIDERIKIISDKTILSDEKSYTKRLESLGYTVIPLPKPSTPFGNYANSLLINGTVFVPTFDDLEDDKALQIYKNLGLKVVPINSNLLTENKGSIHCMTATYP